LESQRAHSRRASLTGTEIDVPQPFVRALRLPSGRFWADYAALAREHVQYFPDAAAAKAHVEQVLSEASVAIPRRSGNIDLVARSAMATASSVPGRRCETADTTCQFHHHQAHRPQPHSKALGKDRFRLKPKVVAWDDQFLASLIAA
jgi:hypothetical protein